MKCIYSWLMTVHALLPCSCPKHWFVPCFLESTPYSYVKLFRRRNNSCVSLVTSMWGEPLRPCADAREGPDRPHRADSDSREELQLRRNGIPPRSKLVQPAHPLVLLQALRMEQNIITIWTGGLSIQWAHSNYCVNHTATCSICCGLKKE